MSEVPEELLRLRASIDNMDEVIVRVLAERFKITQRVGELKAEVGFRRPTRRARSSRSPGCAASPSTRGWIRRSLSRS